jgi:3D (Asp-Asp-Asp) domain-containing protein
MLTPAVSMAGEISVADYPSIQAAIDANPGRMLLVPPGDHHVSGPVLLNKDGNGLYGYGTIVQDNPEKEVVRIDHARGVRLRDLTLTRAEGVKDATAPGVLITDAQDASLEGLRVLDCRARDAAVDLRNACNCTVRGCEITNYKRIAVDDRTGDSGGNVHYGYAFRCIDGTGVMVRESTGTVIADNRIVDHNLMPTREMKEQHKLGELTEGKYPTKAGNLGRAAVERGRVDNWHQGSAIVVTSPEATAYTNVTGNYIENAAQGIDLHSDYVICANNTINRGMMGIKLTHGARNLVVSGNIITRVDLWGILLNPGAASHAAEVAQDDKPARAANVDGGTIVANNIISEYGYGNEYWNWGGARENQGGSFAMAFFEGQLPENPPLRDVIVQGNIVYNTGRDGEPDGAEIKQPAPRYRYAVYIGPWGEGSTPRAPLPEGLHFSNNILHAGTAGVSNAELTP